MANTDVDLGLGRSKLGSSNQKRSGFAPKKGLSIDIVNEMSWMKGEPSWMRGYRKQSLSRFEERPMPNWGGDLSGIDVDDIVIDATPSEPAYVAGSSTAREESDAVYHKNRRDLEEQGVIFTDMDAALRNYPGLVLQYFGKIVPPEDNKFSALNSAVWSGGTFVYVPPNTEVDLPLQAYSRINSMNVRPFERTLIIADEGAKVHFIEGCSAPVYSMGALRATVVEIMVRPHAQVTYNTIQNWSNNVFNLATKRARVEEGGHMDWIEGNIGSQLTMTYPGVVMVGPKASGSVLSASLAGAGQHQDVGANMTHLAPETTSKVIAKSISTGDGRTTYRGMVRVDPDVHGCTSVVRCDALVVDDCSVSDMYPGAEIGSPDAVLDHDATVSKVDSQVLFYLMSRGLSEEQARGTIVNGFIEPVTRALPMEYGVEWTRLIELQMEGSVG